MARRRPPHWFQQKRSLKPPPSDFYLLDKFSVEDIPKYKAFAEKISRFHWDYYSNLAYQRNQIVDKLKAALLEAAEKSYTFSRWQRVVKYKYALDPLLLDGSLTDPGGRFNIGNINPTQFTPFPALYIASDKDTALQETLSQKIKPGEEPRALDFALSNPASIASVSISGYLDDYINLENPEQLRQFVNLMKDFTIPSHLIKTSKEIWGAPPELMRSEKNLLDSLLFSNWKSWPMQCDVPHTSQIFGQLVMQSGIDGILYPSKFTSKNCLVIYPQNFVGSDSFVQIDDESPVGTTIRRLDAESWAKINTIKSN